MKWLIPRTFTMVLLAIVLYETSANALFFLMEGHSLTEVHIWIWVFPITVFVGLWLVNTLSQFYRRRVVNRYLNHMAQSDLDFEVFNTEDIADQYLKEIFRLADKRETWKYYLNDGRVVIARARVK